MTKLISPAPGGWMGLEFGNTTEKPYSPSRPHMGRDWGYYYADPWNSQRVVAPVSGTVESVYAGGGNNQGWGNRVVIRVNSRVASALNHLSTGTIKVSPGQWVNAGDYIGQMGATGETYGQTHLHEELYIDGKRDNPDYYREHDLPGTESTAGNDSKPFPGQAEEDDMYTQEDRDRDELIRAILLNGTPQDLSVGRLQQIYDAVKNVENRIYIRDANGVPVWDVFQELIPNVRLILNILGKEAAENGAPIDVKALATAISDSLSPEVGKALVSALAEQLSKK